MLKLFSNNYFKARECLNNWRNRLRYYFNYDPLICKFCGKEMKLLSITIKGNTFTLDSCWKDVIDIFKKKKVIYINNPTFSDNWDDVIAKEDTYLNLTCSKCGYSEDVPDWIVGELNPFSRKPSLECPKCNKAMYRTKSK